MLDTSSHLYYNVSDFTVADAEGLYVRDEDGNEFMDCSAGTFNLSLGYRHPAVVQAIKDQADKLIHVSSSYQTHPINEMTSMLAELAPAGLNHVHPKVSGGSSANEGAIKMAQRVTGRTEVITLFRAHVGQTMAMTALSGNQFRKEPFPTLPRFGMQVPDPYCYRCFYRKEPETCGLLCADRIVDFIEYASQGEIAAVLIEPISGNGGNIVPPDGYLQRVREICDEKGIKLIFDEIQTGIGRTGRMFAAEYFDVVPDAITVAKSLGGSGTQVAAIITNDDLLGMESDHHSFTYGSNLIAAAAGLRGGVSLAVALSVDTAVPNREFILFVVAAVVLLSMVVQGLLLPAVIRWARIPSDDTEERETLQAVRSLHVEAYKALDQIAADAGVCSEAVQHVRADMDFKRDAALEDRRIRDDNPDITREELELQTLLGQVQALRLAVITYQRGVLKRLRNEGAIDMNILHSIQERLDTEEVRILGPVELE